MDTSGSKQGGGRQHHLRPHQRSSFQIQRRNGTSQSTTRGVAKAIGERENTGRQAKTSQIRDLTESNLPHKFRDLGKAPHRHEPYDTKGVAEAVMGDMMQKYRRRVEELWTIRVKVQHRQHEHMWRPQQEPFLSQRMRISMGRCERGVRNACNTQQQEQDKW